MGMGWLAAVLGISGALMTSDASAQGAARAPLAKAIVSPDAAKQTLVKVQIAADVARAIVDSCVALSKNSVPPRSTAIFVLAPTGEVVDPHIMDGALPIAIETAMMKAKTSLYARTSSAAVGERFKDGDARTLRMNFGKDQGLAYFFASGGLPIVVDDQLIGAIGVGGGAGGFDEQCAYQSLEKVLGPQPPLTQPAPAAAAPAGRGRAGQ